MQSRIDKIQLAHTEELRVREVKRADDERAARTREQQLAAKVGQIEQERQDEVAKVRSSADDLIERMRKQANSKPANASGMRPTCPVSEGGAGSELHIGVGEDLVRLAQRADELRTALGACYKAYDSLR